MISSSRHKTTTVKQQLVPTHPALRCWHQKGGKASLFSYFPIMSSVNTMIEKFGGVQLGSPTNDSAPLSSQSPSDQYAKCKAPLLSRSCNHVVLKHDKGIDVFKTLDCEPEASAYEERQNVGDDDLTHNLPSDLDKFSFSKTAPTLDTPTALQSKNGRKAPDPSGSTNSRSSRSSKGSCTPKVRKTAIKASDLGIDLKDISTETLNEAVKKWKKEQRAANKPDPVGEASDGSKERGWTPAKARPKSRSKSRGRDNDTTPPRSGRTRPKSRTRQNDVDDTTDKRTVKKKIIVRRRASWKTPKTEGLARATPKRQESKDDLSTLLVGKEENLPSARCRLGETSSVQTVEGVESPKSEPKASPEECVESILEQVPLSPGRLAARRKETFISEAVEKQRSSSRGRMAKARADVFEIQKRLKQAGISDEQYRAMLAAGLTISLA